MTGPAIFNFIWTGGTAGADTFRIAVNAAGTTTQVYQTTMLPRLSPQTMPVWAKSSSTAGKGMTRHRRHFQRKPYALSGIVLGGATETDSLSVLVTDLVDTISFDTAR